MNRTIALLASFAVAGLIGAATPPITDNQSLRIKSLVPGTVKTLDAIRLGGTDTMATVTFGYHASAGPNRGVFLLTFQNGGKPAKVFGHLVPQDTLKQECVFFEELGATENRPIKLTCDIKGEWFDYGATAHAIEMK